MSLGGRDSSATGVRLGWHLATHEGSCRSAKILGKGDRFIYWSTFRYWPISAPPERLLGVGN